MDREQITKIYQSINVISNKVNDYTQRLNSYTDYRDDKNEQDIVDTENAACDLSIELDERMADIENALCELSEE